MLSTNLEDMIQLNQKEVKFDKLKKMVHMVYIEITRRIIMSTSEDQPVKQLFTSIKNIQFYLGDRKRRSQ
tara:strand:- start:1940 stop:2149 length:210 start_codon:yes stop_codon:yes gene_type:complete